MWSERAVVIGAGPAGLAAAAALGARGLAVPVLERGAGPAESWRHRADGLRLNSGKRASQFPGVRYPRGTATFPGRDEVVDYFTRYASAKELDIRPGVRVAAIAPRDGAWLLDTTAGPLEAQDVVVATGMFAVPVMPRWPGRDAFAGEVLHAADYRNPGPFVGRAVVVAGSGTTGMEIATELAAGGARSVALSVRTPPNLVPRIFGAFPGVKLMLRLPPGIGDTQMRVLRRRLIGDLSAHGLPAPHEGPFALLKRTGASPATIDPETLEAIRAGRIRIVAAVAGFGGRTGDDAGENAGDDGGNDQVLLADGSRMRADAVIAATGFRPGLEPLLGDLGVLDEDGVPAPGAARPGLHFIGFARVPGQLVFCRAAARAIARKVAAGGPRP